MELLNYRSGDRDMSMKTEDLIYAIDEKIQEGKNLKTDFFVTKGFLESADITHVVSSVGKSQLPTTY